MEPKDWEQVAEKILKTVGSTAACMDAEWKKSAISYLKTQIEWILLEQKKKAIEAMGEEGECLYCDASQPSGNCRTLIENEYRAEALKRLELL